MQAIVVEPARPDDATAITDVQRQAWLDAYPSPEQGITREEIRLRVEDNQGQPHPENTRKWERSIKLTGTTRATFVARSQGQVVGFIVPKIKKNGQRRIMALYVLPQHQGKGIGWQLMTKALAWHGAEETVYLDVVIYNHRAIEFYRSFGFIETGKHIADGVAEQRGFRPIPRLEMARKPSQI